MSYIPVALTNVLCKIFERMKNKILVWFLEKIEKIDNRQFCFRKQKSILKIITKFLNGFRRKEKITAMYFDIEKAYDKVNRKKTFEHRKTWEYREECWNS